jgi:hypothetical protein
MKKIIVAIAFLGFIACKSKNATPAESQPKTDSPKVEIKQDTTQGENQRLKEEAPKPGNQ